ncbi:hypothetical protein niasHT_018711 [Heterodera trifolii]|uniref:Intraflagellar transport protein 46 homolog n=1 Tax=Heterodera trifolii TaxID=157864 RepID=A0ABD2LB99_9BILA
MGAKFEGGQLRAVKTPCQPIQEAVTECWIGVVGLLINANLDVNLEDCADLCLFCLVDIPMHKSRLESKHVLFSLYAELRASQHLRNMARDRDEADGATSAGDKCVHGMFGVCATFTVVQGNAGQQLSKAMSGAISVCRYNTKSRKK